MYGDRKTKKHRVGERVDLWKFLVVLIFCAFVWIRIGPAIAWTMGAVTYGEKRCSYGYNVEYNWSWWSLRFTSIYPVCNR